ncbi:TetR/AcrR family transcriptional regulator [Rhodococcus maanshanensis]|uniref:DNA-binding transcriptional regulator, AcrR family n=1 Tax=Rhodococcus maanshanensis TaxID=183556 RepID=A0A1H7TAB9_9NOCA|nr:TetR/AcrR family transcriptional regulator [Rhodococcus maanshanensis]SEL81459.1 DNA-binding transcriptional regulator, AcrR family [Rhodococcus maanshanensis]
MSLRERQRLQVRADLQRAAFELFARDGFDAVTTEQIAAAAGVSPSTYFRHVRSKEDLLLEPVHEGGAGIVALVEQRPESEPADVALARAILSRSTTLGASEIDRWRAAFRTAPHLMDRVTLIAPEHRARLVELVAQRMGRDPEVDSRPGLLVHLMLAAAEFGYRQWIRSPRNRGASLPVCVEGALDAVLHPRWGMADGNEGKGVES